MVCWHGGCPQEVRCSPHLRGLSTPELVLREVHPLPKVDETLVQMAGATVFSNDVVEAHATALN